MKKALLAALLLVRAPGLWAGPLVLLDPGHGGTDPGVSAQGLREADYVLALAKRIEPLLVARGCEVALTREGDQNLSLTARVEMANALQPLALVSLHVNSAFQSSAQGPRLFVPAAVKVDEPEAPLWEQAAGMHAAASHTLGEDLAQALGLKGPRAVQTLKLGLFRGLNVPACLVELGFASNPADLAALKDDAAQQVLAAKLAGGIAAYVLGAHQEAAVARPKP